MSTTNKGHHTSESKSCDWQVAPLRKTSINLSLSASHAVEGLLASDGQTD